MDKKRIIEFEVHAMHRMLHRGAKFGLDYFETESRVKQTASQAIKSRRILSKNPVYYQYFPDNLCFYVVCKERAFEDAVYVRVITVIIQRGRE
jgi:hypothetical protein